MEADYDDLVEGLEEGRALYTPEQAQLFDDAAYPGLCQKLEAILNGGRFSPQMIAIVGRIVGKRWTDPELASLAITSDGFVVEGFRGILGEAPSFDANLQKVVTAAELGDDELELIRRLANTAVERFDGKVCLADDQEFDLSVWENM